MNRVAATPTTQIDDGVVRVTRWDFPPGSETGPHRHEFDYVVVPITAGTLTIEFEAAETVEAPLEIGGSYNRSAGVEHNVVNLGADPVAFVEIELLEHPATDPQ